MSQVTVIEVPQWQGSSSPTAHRLRDGAKLLAEMVPNAVHLRVDIADGDAPAALATTAGRTRAALAQAPDGLVVTVGGDCGVDLAPVSAALDRYGDRLALVWFDAHGDLNTPGSSPSGAFHGMVLRTLTGEGHDALLPEHPIHPERIVLAGARDLDPAERDFATSSGLTHLGVTDLSDPATLVQAVTDTGADVVYIHIDLDVLDPATFASVGVPAPGGLLPDDLLKLVRTLTEHFELAGIGITEYEPSRPEDQLLLTPLIANLTTP
ncbi:arginase family protein [Nonomuraea dietziae]|uniref:Arginase n=1 Tax=Nonomuraea dietziae TaxID=65515 RepID=A0A7W5V4H6_9ACTN|nr:arginase family protein [Nonomuraea dietziae]MBB3730411.1 arginase [Nonomuraea dietziae]